MPTLRIHHRGRDGAPCRVPAGFQRSWRRSDWTYDADTGQIADAAGDPIPLTYFILGVSRTLAA